jgi:hypothetical protein
VAAVSGYTVTGYSTGLTTNDDTFLIHLEEKPYLDTGVTPSWDITRNDSLEAQAGINELVIISAPPEVPIDNAEPIIGYTLAVSGKEQIFIHFSEPVYDTAAPAPLAAANFTNFGVTAVGVVTSGGSGGNGIREALLTSNEIMTADIVTQTLLTTDGNIVDEQGIALGTATAVTSHRVSDVGLGREDNGLIQPVYANDTTSRDPIRGGVGIIREFDGSVHLQPEDLHFNIYIDPDPTLGAVDPTMYFQSDVDEDYIADGLWLPTFDDTIDQPQDFSGLVPIPNPGTDTVAPYASSAQLRDYSIPESNSNIYDKAVFDFFFEQGGLYYGRIFNDTDNDWYRNVRPWSFDIRELITQRSAVTIVNNVINPTSGDKASIHYTLTDTSMVVITVFSLGGDIVDILQRGEQSAGNYSTSWDGTNMDGTTVARGIYFVRFVAEGVDEYRKILVVK